MKNPKTNQNTENIITQIYNNLRSQIIGQDELIQNLLIALLSGGHILIEGMPGLAKTLSAATLANSVNAKFKRIQFTPDLLPSDLIGTDIYLQERGRFEFSEGPLFSNIILADEINRAPAKVQSALLEAMAEGQITAGKKTYKLPELFMVIATQNPLEQEGTYALPEAQLDRFLMQVKISYPDAQEELQILELAEKQDSKNIVPLKNIAPQDILAAREKISQIYLDEKLKQYIVNLVMASREAEKYDQELASYIKFGASPRATLALAQTAKALAYLNGDEFVTPYHIQKMAPYILSHRIILSYKAAAANLDNDQIVKYLIDLVAV